MSPMLFHYFKNNMGFHTAILEKHPMLFLYLKNNMG